ncbi:hypothetical protein [Candidatus Albibeggiatoa sp. nov. BB20]
MSVLDVSALDDVANNISVKNGIVAIAVEEAEVNDFIRQEREKWD